MSPTLRALLFALAACFACDAAAGTAAKGKYAQRPWGAIAYNSKTGAYGYAVDYSTRRAAETEAFRACGGEACKALVWACASQNK